MLTKKQRAINFLELCIPKPVRIAYNSAKTTMKLGLGSGRGRVRLVEEGHRKWMIEGQLDARIVRANGIIEEKDLGKNTVTDAGVAFLVNNWYNKSTDINTFNYHEMGTGGAGTPPVTDTTLTTPVESRGTGTLSKPNAWQIRSVGTCTATTARSIIEWGLFSASTSGTMWSKRRFATITLASGDSIEFTYTLTFTAFEA